MGGSHWPTNTYVFRTVVEHCVRTFDDAVERKKSVAIMHVNQSLKMAIGTPTVELNDWAIIGISKKNNSEINKIDC